MNSKYLTAASVSLRERLAYPSAFAGTLLTYGLFIFVFSRIWASVYADKALIAGYSRSMAVWYFIIAEITVFGMGRFFNTLSPDIKNGQVAYLIARPYDFTFFNFAQSMGTALSDAAVLLLEGFALGLIVAGPLPVTSVGQAAALVLSLLLAGTLQFFLQFSLAMTAFWVEENAAFYWIYQKIALVAGTLLPLEFLPETARAIIRWTPFPYVVWAPARITVAWEALGVEGAARIIGAQVLWVGAAVLLCRVVFNAGRRSLSVNGG